MLVTVWGIGDRFGEPGWAETGLDIRALLFAPIAVGGDRNP
jgi:hypothetical protein